MTMQRISIATENTDGIGMAVTRVLWYMCGDISVKKMCLNWTLKKWGGSSR